MHDKKTQQTRASSSQGSKRSPDYLADPLGPGLHDSLYDPLQAAAHVQLRGGKVGSDAIKDAAAGGVSGNAGAYPHGDAIQKSFGKHDMSHLKSFNDAPAKAANEQMGAEAYTTGDKVAFGGAPSLHTAAHEAAHAKQQESGVSLSGGVGQKGDSYEQHADSVADKVVKGESAEGLLSQMGGGGGAGIQKKPKIPGGPGDDETDDDDETKTTTDDDTTTDNGSKGDETTDPNNPGGGGDDDNPSGGDDNPFANKSENTGNNPNDDTGQNTGNETDDDSETDDDTGTETHDDSETDDDSQTDDTGTDDDTGSDDDEGENRGDSETGGDVTGSNKTLDPNGGEGDGSDVSAENTTGNVGSGTGTETDDDDETTSDDTGTSDDVATGEVDDAESEVAEGNDDAAASFITAEPLNNAPLGLHAPPDMKKRHRKKLIKESGLAPDEHHSRVESAFQTLITAAARRYQDITAHSESLIADFQKSAQGWRDEVDTDALNKKGAITAGYDSARSKCTDSAAGAIALLEDNATLAEDYIKSKAREQLNRVSGVKVVTTKKLDPLKPEFQEKVSSSLSAQSKGFKGSTTTVSQEMADSANKLLTTYGDAGNSFERAVNEDMRKWIMEGAKGTIAAFSEEGEVQAKIILDMIPTLCIQVAQLIDGNPEAESATGKKGMKGQVADFATQVQGAIRGSRKDALKNIKTSKASAIAAIEAYREQSLAQLTADEVKAHGLIDQAATSIKGEVTKAETGVVDEIVAANGRHRLQYEQSVELVRDNLPKEGLVDWRDYEVMLATAYGSLGGLLSKHTGELSDIVGGATNEVGGAIANLRGYMDALGNTTLSEGTRVQNEQVLYLLQGAEAFRTVLDSIAFQTEKAMTATADASPKQLGLIPPMAREALDGMLKDVRKQLFMSRMKYKQALRVPIQAQVTEAKAQHDTLWGALAKDVEWRRKKAYNAMYDAHILDYGTDEEAVFAALRNMTPLEGKALEWYWNKVHKHSLRWWLADELDYDEKKSALAYLEGDQAEGARWALSASQNWWNTQEDIIEQTMMELPEDDRKKLVKHKDWKQVEGEIEYDLDGTDLLVFQSAKVGNKDRARAYRLMDDIEKSRMKDDFEELLTTMEGIPQENLSGIQVEFYKIQQGVDPTEFDLKDKDGNVVEVDQEEAATSFGDWVTADRTKIVHHEHGSTEINLSLDKTESNLTKNLAVYGTEDVRTRVHYLAYDEDHGTNETFSGHHDLQNVEKALWNKEFRDLPDEEREQKQKEYYDAFCVEYEKAYGKAPDESLKKIFEGDEKGLAIGMELLESGDASLSKVLRYGVDRAGTDEELLERWLDGVPKEMIDQALKDDPTLKEDVLADVSGDLDHDLQVAFMGAPESDRDYYAICKLHYDYARGSGKGFLVGKMGPPGTLLGSLDPENTEQAERLDRNWKEMKGMVNALGGEGSAFIAEGTDGAGRFIGDHKRFVILIQELTGAYEDYQSMKDKKANFLTTAVTALIAIVAAPFTGGASLLTLSLLALGTGLVSMGLNYGLRGDSYGWEEALKDGIITVGQAATAGLGKFLETKWLGQFTDKWDDVAKAELWAGRLSGLTEEGLNTMFDTAMNDKTWDEGFTKGGLEIIKNTTKTGLTVMASDYVSTYVGDKLEKIDNDALKFLSDDTITGAGLRNAIGETAGTLTSSLTGTVFDVIVTGDNETPWEDMMGGLGEELTTSFVKGFLSGAFKRSVNGPEKKGDHGDDQDDQDEKVEGVATINPEDIGANFETPKIDPAGEKLDGLESFDNFKDGKQKPNPDHHENPEHIDPTHDDGKFEADPNSSGEHHEHHEEKKKVPGQYDAAQKSTLEVLNGGSETDLIALPGIGDKLAKKIISERNNGKVFHSYDDLQTIKGIGDKKVAGLEKHNVDTWIDNPMDRHLFHQDNEKAGGSLDPQQWKDSRRKLEFHYVGNTATEIWHDEAQMTKILLSRPDLESKDVNEFAEKLYASFEYYKRDAEFSSRMGDDGNRSSAFDLQGFRESLTIKGSGPLIHLTDLDKGTYTFDKSAGVGAPGGAVFTSVYTDVSGMTIGEYVQKMGIITGDWGKSTAKLEELMSTHGTEAGHSKWVDWVQGDGNSTAGGFKEMKYLHVFDMGPLMDEIRYVGKHKASGETEITFNRQDQSKIDSEGHHVNIPISGQDQTIHEVVTDYLKKKMPKKFHDDIDDLSANDVESYLSKVEKPGFGKTDIEVNKP